MSTSTAFFYRLGFVISQLADSMIGLLHNPEATDPAKPLYTGSPDGSYWYAHGFNLSAIIAWVVGFALAMPGMIAAANPSVVVSDGIYKYYLGTICSVGYLPSPRIPALVLVEVERVPHGYDIAHRPMHDLQGGGSRAAK
ncbi:hypothetical protein BKA56DRAFT_660306 [Ilyonectria sp. MPI-CAGE-AT-0026]|nr:hypothetical protein BKA56DRAFT_660306 [Ilyonectria sp. MPI-CAGE-AT-0026]